MTDALRMCHALLLFTACAANPVAQDAQGLAGGPPHSEGRPQPAPQDSVISLSHGSYTTRLQMAGLTSWFEDGGATITDAGSEVLTIRTTAWGRVGTLEPVGAPEPSIGSCAADVAGDGGCVQRLEYADAGLTEWWVGLDTGLEQGWTLQDPPPGAGALVFEVAVDGAIAEGDGLGITDASGRAWTVGDVTAWDARGEPLPARLTARRDGLHVEVDDTGAEYPVTIDPVYATAAWTGAGGATNAYFGYGVSDAGDVNGDGYDDVIVGEPVSGKAYVYQGSATGLGTTASWSATGDADGGFGQTVSGLGDVNGDGYDEVAVGGITPSVHIYAGSAHGLTTSGTTISGGTSFGKWAISGVGDVNGDGYDDLIVGEMDSGHAYVYLGSRTGLAYGSTLTGDSGGFYAQSLSDAGDVNGDGYGDVIVGEPHDQRAYVYLGSATGLSTAPSTTLSSSAAYFGMRVSGAGDVNGDGYDDVIVGDYASSGSVFVYLGSATGIATTPSSTLTGSDYFGSALSGAGDVNHDGYADIVVGAWYYNTGTGKVFVFEGSATGLGRTPVTTITGATLGTDLGYSVSGAGDVDGDGYDDVIAGAYASDSYRGRAYLYSGYAPDADGDSVPADVDCDDADATVGAPPVRYVDADGDGYGGVESVEVCPSVAGYADTSTDCDDSNADVHPDAAEVCNGIDDNCNITVDEGVLTTYFADADQDGYGDGDAPRAGCAPPSGYIPDDTDCDDSDAAVHPGADEVVGDGIDQDCDGEDEAAPDTGSAEDSATEPPRTGCGCAHTPDGGAGLALAWVAAATLGARRKGRG